MFRSTVVCLVLLRLAIGWHFFFEGLDKIRTMRIGPTDTNRPFSSAGYFREAPGPLGPVMRDTLGDPHEEARARLVPKGLPEGRLEKPAEHMPPALERDWDGYLNRFVTHFGLDQQQREQAQDILKKSKSSLVTRLTWDDRTTTPTEQEKIKQGVKKVKKVYPGGVVEIDQTLPERVNDYVKSLNEVHRAQTSLWYFGKDVEKQRMTKAKIDLEQKRADLMKDLDEKTTEMEQSLADVLTEKEPLRNHYNAYATIVLQNQPLASAACASYFLKVPKIEKGEVPPPPAPWLLRMLGVRGDNWALQTMDVTTAYGLTLLGAFLLLGLLTRFSSLLLAGFLLMTYLAVPAFPWLPVPPNTEGNYYYVNKNLIEMLALLVLATIPTGRWFGIDALLRAIRVALFGEPKKPGQQAGTTTTFTAPA